MLDVVTTYFLLKIPVMKEANPIVRKWVIDKDNFAWWVVLKVLMSLYILYMTALPSPFWFDFLIGLLTLAIYAAVLTNVHGWIKWRMRKNDD